MSKYLDCVKNDVFSADIVKNSLMDANISEILLSTLSDEQCIEYFDSTRIKNYKQLVDNSLLYTYSIKIITLNMYTLFTNESFVDWEANNLSSKMGIYISTEIIKDVSTSLDMRKIVDTFFYVFDNEEDYVKFKLKWL